MAKSKLLSRLEVITSGSSDSKRKLPLGSSIDEVETDVNHRPSRGSYQGLRHLMPKNILPQKAVIRGKGNQKQLEALKQVNRLTTVKPPFVHRPNGGYVGSVLFGSDN